MSVERLINGLANSFIAAQDFDRTTFITNFCAINRTQSLYFRHSYMEYLRKRQIDPQSVTLLSLLNAFYLNYYFSCLANAFVCVILHPDDIVALEFALLTNPTKKAMIVTPRLDIRQWADSIDGDRVRVAPRLALMARDAQPGTVQMIIAINTWDQNAALEQDLAGKLAPGAVVTTLVHGPVYEPPRSGPKVRELFTLRGSGSVELTETKDAGQYFATMAVFY